MSVILILIGASLFVAICFLIAFIWAVRTGQYEDKYTPSVRILFDDELIQTNQENVKNLANNDTKLKEADQSRKDIDKYSIKNKKDNSKQLLKSE